MLPPIGEAEKGHPSIAARAGSILLCALSSSLRLTDSVKLAPQVISAGSATVVLSSFQDESVFVNLCPAVSLRAQPPANG